MVALLWSIREQNWLGINYVNKTREFYIILQRNVYKKQVIYSFTLALLLHAATAGNVRNSVGGNISEDKRASSPLILLLLCYSMRLRGRRKGNSTFLLLCCSKIGYFPPTVHCSSIKKKKRKCLLPAFMLFPFELSCGCCITTHHLFVMGLVGGPKSPLYSIDSNGWLESRAGGWKLNM